MEDPFDPDQFGDYFAEALQAIADDDCGVEGGSDLHAYECTVTMGGIDYSVTVVPSALKDVRQPGKARLDS